MGFSKDTSRDILVAKHMVEVDKFQMIRPHMDGGKGLIVNSPLYYFFIASMWFITRSAHGMSAASIAISIVAIWAAYGVGKNIRDSGTGLTAALFVSVSPILSGYARNFWQPHLLPPITAVNLYLFFLLYKTKNPVWIYVLMSGLFVGLHMHVSYAPVFFISMFWLGAEVLKVAQKHPRHLVGAIVAVLLHSGLWVSATAVRPIVDHVAFFGEMLRSNSGGVDFIGVNVVRNITSPFRYVLEPFEFLKIDPVWLGALFVGIMGCFVLVDARRHKKPYAFVLFSLLLSLMYTGINQNLVAHGHYFAPYYIIITLILAYIIHRLVTYLPIRLLIILLLTLIFFRGNTQMFFVPSSGEWQMTRELSKQIANDYINLTNGTVSSINIYWKELGAWHFDWFTSSVWYHLEVMLGRNLMRIVPEGGNIESLEKQARYNYLICESDLSVGDNQEVVLANCVHPFIAQYSHIDPSSTFLLTHFAGEMPYTLHVYRLMSFE